MEAAQETAEMCKNVKRPGDLGSLETAAHQVDVRDETSVNNLVDGVARTYGRIDVLVNTAGVSHSLRSPFVIPSLPFPAGVRLRLGRLVRPLSVICPLPTGAVSTKCIISDAFC